MANPRFWASGPPARPTSVSVCSWIPARKLAQRFVLIGPLGSPNHFALSKSARNSIATTVSLGWAAPITPRPLSPLPRRVSSSPWRRSDCGHPEQGLIPSNRRTITSKKRFSGRTELLHPFDPLRSCGFQHSLPTVFDRVRHHPTKID